MKSLLVHFLDKQLLGSALYAGYMIYNLQCSPLAAAG